MNYRKQVVRVFVVSLACVSLMACAPKDTALHGYVEADLIRVAAAQSGRLTELKVQRGDNVRSGQALFILEQDNERFAVAEAQARLNQAQAEAADLATGKRRDELAVITAQLKAAQANAQQAQADYTRQRKLIAQGFIAQSTLDAFKARLDSSQAQVREFTAQLRVAKLAGRPEAREALAAGTRAAQAQVAQQQWRVEQKTVYAPLTARVEDRYFLPGEWINAGTPVLSLLANDHLKIRFWVPQASLNKTAIGNRISVSCDNCGASITATINFVAREAEFTPPVIYSKESRTKLVFLVEAQTSAQDATHLHPGQPVDIHLP